MIPKIKFGNEKLSSALLVFHRLKQWILQNKYLIFAEMFGETFEENNVLGNNLDLKPQITSELHIKL